MTPCKLPACPALHTRPNRSAALGWVASAAVVALTLSGLAALAMAAAPKGESLGAEPVEVLLLPAPAIAALSEPAPDVVTDAPEAPDAPTVSDEPPGLTTSDDPAPDHLDPPALLLDQLRDDPAPSDAPLPPPAPKPAELAEAAVEPHPEEPPEEPEQKAEPKATKKTAKTDTTKAKAADSADDSKTKPTEPASTAASASAPVKKAPAATSAGSGKKAAADYGASVMKKIRKTKKKRAPTNGSVVVSFTISDSGELSSLKVAKSSGSAELDQIAVDHIARSAPFAAPPPGAARKFSFEFVGKG